MSPSSPFRLFARFALAGLIGFFLIAFILFQIWMRTFEQRLLDETEQTTARYIALVGHMLTEEDFRAVKKGPDWQAFRGKIGHLLSLPEVVRVKIYNREGALIWSDSLGLLELSLPARKNPELLRSLEGHVEANISRLQKEEHQFERGTFRTLMELYVPIYLDLEQRNKLAGVAEVYLNIDSLFATIRDTGWLIGLTVIGGLALLLSVAFIGLSRAVALIHKKNQELQAALEEIFKVSREKDELVASLRHEFRNPEAVMSYAGLLLDGALGNLPQKLKPSLEKMRNIAAEFLSHFSRTLELTRLKVGDVLPRKEPVDLAGLLRDITSDLRLFSGNGAISLKLKLPPGEVIINSDRKLLQRVFLDLVANAIKCTVKGHIGVCLETAPQEREVKVIVEDTGVGIKADDLPKIFDEFYRGNDPHVRFRSGVGLGLAIVKRSLALLGGQIDVQSIHGKGSKFTITLPREL